MPKSLTKVVYKPGTQSTDGYTIMVNPAEFKKWKAGDTTIPLADVVDSFGIFYSSQGRQGFLGQPSKQQLENTFGTSNDVEVVKILLEKGKEQSGEGIHSENFGTNATRGRAFSDNKGKGLSGI